MRKHYRRRAFTPVKARRLKAAVLAVSCVLGIGLGIGSAAFGHYMVPGSKSHTAPEARQVSIEAFETVLQSHAEAAVPVEASDPGSR
jgi:hypothetical protein